MIRVQPRSVHSAEYQLLAARLRAAREGAGLSQRALAARLNKPPSYPHKVETAERELNVIELMDYCAALGVDFSAFVRELTEELAKLRN